MTNSWSLLYEELKMNEDRIMNDDPLDQLAKDTYEIYVEGIKERSKFEIARSQKKEDNMLPWGHSDMEALSNQIDLNLESTEKNGFWKYEEDLTMKEIRDYLSGTYKSHYTSQESKTQTLDLIESIGDAEPFCRSNAIKYLSRFGKKNGKSKLDILKAIHYCILLYHFSGLHQSSTNHYETF